ncbi:hypothetical protein ACLB2K_024154 [Fragaria x ananassa]
MANQIFFCTMLVLAMLTTINLLWIPSTMTPFHQSQEEREEPRTSLLYPVVEGAMKYGLPMIGILVILIVLYKRYPNTFRFLSIYGLLHYLGVGAATAGPTYPGTANPSVINAGVISAGGGILVTLLRWVARRGGRGAGIPEQVSGERRGAFLVVAIVGGLTATVAYVGGPRIMNSIRAAAGGSVRAGRAAYRFLLAPFRIPPEEDLELQSMLNQPPIHLQPNEPGLLQILYYWVKLTIGCILECLRPIVKKDKFLGFTVVSMRKLLVILIVLYKRYTNTFMFLSIYGLLHYLGVGAGIAGLTYPGTANPSVIASVISAHGGIMVTLLRWVARRGGGRAGIPKQVFGERRGVFLVVAIVEGLTATMAYVGGPSDHEFHQSSYGPEEYLELQPMLNQPPVHLQPNKPDLLQPEEDLELQPMLNQPPVHVQPNKPGLLQPEEDLELQPMLNQPPVHLQPNKLGLL